MPLIERLLSVKPHTFTFLCALFLFFRALSGAGYVEPVPEYEISESPTATETMGLNYAHLTNASLDMHSLGYAGFAEHWVKFKDAILSCPSIDESNGRDEELRGLVPVMKQTAVEDRAETNSGSNSATPMDWRADARARMAVIQATDLTTAKWKSSQTSVACLKAHLENRIGLYGSKWLEVKQEERTFGVSFDGLPLRVKRDSNRPRLPRDSGSRSAT